MKILNCICTLAIVVCRVGYINTQTNTPCDTTQGRPGECVSIKDCPPSIDLLNTFKLKKNDSIIDYFRANHCGYEDRTPKICCNMEEIKKIISGDEIIVDPNTVKKKEQVIHSPLLPSREECGRPNVDDRIFGGTESSEKESPWLAQLMYNKPNNPTSLRYGCGATLISSRYILTAAHCVQTGNYAVVKVILGVGNENFTAQEYYVEEIKTHQNFTREMKSGEIHNDIALIRLNTTVQFSEWIMPICLPTTTKAVKTNMTGRNFIIYGWGKTENGTRDLSKASLKVWLPYVELQDCFRIYEGIGVRLGAGQFCAGGVKGKDTCGGDSGGTLSLQLEEDMKTNWFAMGIVSYGIQTCGKEGFPGVYTSIPHFMSWIVRMLKP